MARPDCLAKALKVKGGELLDVELPVGLDGARSPESPGAEGKEG